MRDHDERVSVLLEHLRFPGDDARYRAACNALFGDSLGLSEAMTHQQKFKDGIK